MKSYKNIDGRSNRMWSGLIVLLIGIVFLLSNFGIDMPHWLFSWSTFLLVIGLIVGAKRNYNGGGWLIMVLIGAYFTLTDMTDMNLSKYYLSFALIALGLYLVLKPRKSFMTRMQEKEQKLTKKMADFGGAGSYEATGTSGANDTAGDTDRFKATDGSGAEEQPLTGDDFVDSVNVFAGSKQNIFSKNFQGGDVISIFGGCELNLTHADFKDAVVIEVVALFGGLKIVVPPTWRVKSEVTAIFGGLEDKRTVLPPAGQQEKIIRIKGLALFGGISVTNY